MKKFKMSGLLSLMLATAMLSPTQLLAKEVAVTDKTAAVAVQEVKKPEEIKIINNENQKTITILGTSDVHGRIFAYDYAVDEVDADAGYAKIQSVIKEQKAKNPNSILIDAGDTLQDNSAELFNERPVHPMVEALNEVGYDTWTLGNHEFNFGLDFLNRNIAAFKGDVLACNIYKEDGTRFVKPYKIINKDGVRVAIVGLLAPHVPTWEASSPEHFKGLTFKPVVAEAQKAVKELEGKYDVLIGAFHVGFEGEYGEAGIKEVAEACPQFNMILSGHAHSKYDDKEVNGVKIAEPSSCGGAVTNTTIQLKKDNKAWKVDKVGVKNIDTTPYAEDEGMKAKFGFVHKTSVDNANEVVGKVKADFVKGVDYITGEDKVTTMPTTQMEDTALIDFINEVQLFYSGADISTAAAFKPDMKLKAGDFKRKDVANIYKYSNTLMGVKMTGENLKKYMEWSARYYNTYKTGDVTISFNPEIRSYNYDMFAGVKYDIDLSKEAGNRVVNLTFNGKPIENEKTYKVAINNYRYGTLKGLNLITDADKYYDSYDLFQDQGRIRDLIVKYVQEQKKGDITPVCDNNWKIIGADLNHPQKAAIYEMIKKGEVKIPVSEDGRTCNIKSINVNDLKAEGKIK